MGGYFTGFRPNCAAVMRALVQNNGSQYTETRDQGLTFKQNTVPGQTLKSFNDLDDAYWTLLGESSPGFLHIYAGLCTWNNCLPLLITSNHQQPHTSENRIVRIDEVWMF